MKDELVSAIVAAYNCEAYIRQSIDSLIKQTHENLEILICDDCSTDQTWNILQTYKDSRIKLFQNKINIGVVETRNFLLAQATGHYLLIQDADDWSEHNRVETLLDFFQNNSVDAIGTGYFRINNKGERDFSLAQPSTYLTLDDCYSLPFMPSTFMLRYSVYKDLGGYNDYFSRLLAEDLYWVVSIIAKYKVFYLNKSLYNYRFNPSSITNSIIRKDKLVTLELINQLINQRKISGSDWVVNGDYLAIQKFKKEKLYNKKWLSEQYRIAAAVQCDGGKYRIAILLLLRAIFCHPLNLTIYRTGIYLLRSIISRSK